MNYLRNNFDCLPEYFTNPTFLGRILFAYWFLKSVVNSESKTI